MPKVGSGSIALVDLNDVRASVTAPTLPYEGMLWFNSTDNQLYIYKSGAWVISNNVVVGGTNLLEDSNKFTSGGSATGITVTTVSEGVLQAVSTAGNGNWMVILASDYPKLESKMNEGDLFTISLEMKSPNHTLLPNFYIKEAMPYQRLKGKMGTEWSQVYITNTWKKTGNMVFHIGLEGIAGTTLVRNIKVEKGNIPTTWSPAPEDAEKKIANLGTLMDNISNDNLLDLKDRQKIKDQLFQITGSIIADATTTMPTTATLDTGLKGSFYKVRKAAFNAGVLTTHASYIAVATHYNNLKTYLEAITPVESWDTGLANRNYAISVVKATFRDRWMQYYLAEQALEVVTADQLKKNVDNVQVGGRNWVRNSSFNYVLEDTTTLTDWETIEAPFTAIDAEADKPTSRILNINRTGLTADAIVSAYSNRFPARIGDVFTVSLDIKTADPVAWTTQTAFIFEGWNSAGTRVMQTSATVAQAGISSMVANVWYRAKFTYTITADLSIAKLRLLQYRNGNVSFREIQVEKGNQMTDWTPAPEDNSNQLYILEEKYNNAMQTLDEDSITTTVMNNTSYKDAMAELATQEQLGSYAKGTDLTDATSALETTMDDKISKIDFTPYALQSAVDQTATDLTVKFSAGGGINMINNSVGYNDTKGWTLTGTVGTVNDSSLSQYGYDSGFASTLGVAGSIYQMPYTIVDQSYTISFWIRKNTESSTTLSAIKVSVLDSTDAEIVVLGKLSGSGVMEEYEKITHTFVATSSKTKVKIEFEQNAGGVVSGLMLNIGLVGLQWSMAPGELYNTNIKMDKNGITVNNFTDGVEVGRTVMTPDKFAGYYDIDGSGVIDDSNNSPDEAFRLDKDEFIMKKAVVRNEITMGTVKIVNVENVGGFTGWAFTGNKTIQS